MDHTQATRAHAAERYVLGELPAEEAADFERHFFECGDCAEAVEAGGEFIANAREVLRTEAARPIQGRISAGPQKSIGRAKPGWSWGWMPAAAALAFAAIALYQNVIVIPGMRTALESPRDLPTFQLAGASRGEQRVIRVPAGTMWMALLADLPPDARYPRYASIVSLGAGTVFRVTTPAPRDGQSISVLVPVRSLAPGNYQFTVYGVDGDGQQRDKVATSQFKFQLQ
ncbi:MAG TPA: zf-HC2 domain-containing protein [Bryobacteraceae bacterium]|nr:zf-HC2 domain-containing protein [Bryobacteraceae bacterium]